MFRSCWVALMFFRALVVSLNVQALSLVWKCDASQASRVFHFCGVFSGALRNALWACSWIL